MVRRCQQVLIKLAKDKAKNASVASVTPSSSPQVTSRTSSISGGGGGGGKRKFSTLWVRSTSEASEIMQRELHKNGTVTVPEGGGVVLVRVLWLIM